MFYFSATTPVNSPFLALHHGMRRFPIILAKISAEIPCGFLGAPARRTQMWTVRAGESVSRNFLLQHTRGVFFLSFFFLDIKKIVLIDVHD